jgi:archaeal flagellin FlaB
MYGKYIYNMKSFNHKGMLDLLQCPLSNEGVEMNSSKNNDAGFTGLEAAIVLIAFVVVAAVFSYVVLGAGFFTTQKAQETVHTSVQQASSTLEIVGNVYGTASGTDTSISKIKFSVGLAPGGTPVDFDKVTMTFSTGKVLETLTPESTLKTEPTSGPAWGIAKVQNEVTTDDSLQSGEQFDIVAMPTNKIAKNTKFSIEIKPSVGAAFDVTRTTPASIEPVNILY